MEMIVEQTRVTDVQTPVKAQNGTAPAVDDTIKLTVDVDRLTLGDLELFDKFSEGNTKATELLDFLQRIVVGTDIRTLPLSRMQDVMTAVSAAITQVTNPGN